MTRNFPNPWNFHNTDRQLVSADGSCKIVYYDLSEIAMGAPLGGTCFLETTPNEKVKIHDWCGGPPIWEADGRYVALPIWTRYSELGTVQHLGVLDTHKLKLTIYEAIFRVLDLRFFERNTVYGFDSPLHNSKMLAFDVESEKQSVVISLGK